MTETDTPCCMSAAHGQTCTCRMRLTNGEGRSVDWRSAWYALDADNRALLARAEKAEADKVAAHRQGYAQGKAAGDAFGASLKDHVKRLEAARDTAWNDAIEALLKEIEGHLPEFGAGEPQDGTDRIIDDTFRGFRQIALTLRREDTP